MISIFSNDAEEETRRRDLYLDRLKEPVHPSSSKPAPPGKVFYLNGATSDEPAGAPAGGASPTEARRFSGDAGGPGAGAPAMAVEGVSLTSLAANVAAEGTAHVTPAGPAKRAEPDVVRHMAAKMAPHFAAALASVMQEMQSIASEGSAGIQDSLQTMAAETERLNAGLKSLRQDVDEAMSRSRSNAASESRTAETLKSLTASVEHSRRLVDVHSEAVSTQGLEIQQLRQEVKQQGEAGPAEIRSRLDPMEQKLRDLHKEANQAQASVSAMDERFAALERRLDSQAEAIKTLHAATQGFGARQEILHDLLQKMIGGDRAVQPLPESL